VETWWLGIIPLDGQSAPGFLCLKGEYMELEQTTFDYSILSVETQEFIKAKELAIKARTSQTIWENGRDLLEVKERLEHGQFQKWIEANFPWSYRTVKRFMEVAETFKSDKLADFNFSKSVLYLLAAPSTPEAAREEAIELAEDGKNLSYQQAEDLIKAHKLIKSLEDQIKDLESQLPNEDVINKISELSAQLEKEKNKPPIIETKEIEVIPEDYESIKEKLKNEKKRTKKLIVEKEALLKRLVTPEEIPNKRYKTIVVDPPWPIKKIQRDIRPNQDAFDYATMEVDEIADMPIERMANEDAHLYLWTTQKYLPDALRILKGWGFKYQCLMTWIKNVGFTPYSWMYSTEHILFGSKGTLKLLELGIRLDFNAKVQEHSRKPDIFYEIVRKASPEPRIDVFSREKREGFDQFGNEKSKFMAKR